MRKVIVLGASGGMGYALVFELVARGYQVTAFARNKDRLTRLFQKVPNVTLYPGDAFSMGELDDAVEGNDIIFNAINLPYADWQTALSKLTTNIIATAKKNAANL